MEPQPPRTPRSSPIMDRFQTTSSTPIHFRSGSTQDSNVSGTLIPADINSMLKHELKGAILDDAPNLIESLFPDHKLGVIVDQNLMNSLSNIYNNNRWTLPLNTNSEIDSAEWLNQIGDALSNALKPRRPIRTWTSEYANKPLNGGIKRKPDIILIPVEMHGQPLEWKNICVFGEVTAESKLPVRIGPTIISKTYLCFRDQHDRVFLPCITIFSRASFRLTLTDRSGMVHSRIYDIHTDAIHIVRILIAFIFGDNELLGYDITMRRGMNDEVETIMLNGFEYKVIDTIFHSTSIKGRGTCCWHVKRDQKDYVIKDSWIHEGRVDSEIDILHKISGIQNVPVIVDGGDCQYSDRGEAVVYSTRLHRLDLDCSEPRSHRRIVMEPVGINICQFATKKELIGAFIDVITAHKHLCEDRRILHRDISINNILLWHDPSSNEGRRRGLLIDFDYAVHLQDNRDINLLGNRTGTGPFMAIQVLRAADDTPIVQTPSHDLESIFYVLLYIFMLFKGPRGQSRTKDDIAQLRSFPIGRWFNGENERFRHMADMKLSQLGELEERFLDRCAPYFQDIRPCLLGLWNVLFPLINDGSGEGGVRGLLKPNHATHGKMLAILSDTYVKLPDQETVIEGLPYPGMENSARGARKGKKRFNSTSTPVHQMMRRSMTSAARRTNASVDSGIDLDFDRS